MEGVKLNCCELYELMNNSNIYKNYYTDNDCLLEANIKYEFKFNKNMNYEEVIIGLQNFGISYGLSKKIADGYFK